MPTLILLLLRYLPPFAKEAVSYSTLRTKWYGSPLNEALFYVKAHNHAKFGPLKISDIDHAKPCTKFEMRLSLIKMVIDEMCAAMSGIFIPKQPDELFSS